MKIVYIAGYGRSGSTLVERVLNAHDAMFGTGALWNIWDLEPGEVDDEFWSAVLADLYEELPVRRPRRVQVSTERATRFWKSLGDEGRERRRIYEDLVDCKLSIIERHAPHDFEFLIDSSKTQINTFFRPVALHHYTDHEVYVVHLVRDGRGCLWSNLKGSNRRFGKGIGPPKRFAGLRTVVSWCLSHTGGHVFEHVAGPDRYVRITYEDFCRRPGRVLRSIGQMLDLDLGEQIEMLETQQPIPRAHQIAGNRLRHSDEVVLRYDTEWEEHLDVLHRGLYWLFCGPMALHYGFRPSWYPESAD